MKKILVTGANGLLGSHLVMKLIAKNYEVDGVGRGKSRLSQDLKNYRFHSLDITDGKATYDLVLSLRPDVIIHAAAMTQVDECELHRIDCWNTNVTATRFIIDAARETRSKFILISTDFVFDGVSGPYKEDDLPGPVNYYGSSKWGAEKAAQESGVEWTIIRTVLVYGSTAEGQRQNIVTWIKQQLQKGERIKLVSDQVRTPTFVEDLADGIILCIEKNAKGIFHISGKDTLSPYEMAMIVAVKYGLDPLLIDKVDSTSFSQVALRPPVTGFIIDKARRELGYEPHTFVEAMELMGK